MSTVIVTTREDLAAIMAELLPARGDMPPEVIALEKLKRRDYLTTEEVAMIYPLNASTLRKHRVNGTGPAYIKDGDRVIYAQAAIRKYIDSRRQKTNDQP